MSFILFLKTARDEVEVTSVGIDSIWCEKTRIMGYYTQCTVKYDIYYVSITGLASVTDSNGLQRHQ